MCTIIAIEQEYWDSFKKYTMGIMQLIEPVIMNPGYN